MEMLRFDIAALDEDPERKVRYAHDDGKVYELSLTEVVIARTFAAFLRHGIHPTPKQVSEASALMADEMVYEGWFTYDEFASALATAELQLTDLDDEWQKLDGDAESGI